MKSVFQIIAHARPRDAIGRMALGLDEVFAKAGFTSRIYTEKQRSLLWGRLRKGVLNEVPWNSGEEPAVAFYQHSTGSVACDRFLDWPAKKRILIYQNITPPQFVTNDSHVVWGREQLTQLVNRADFCVAPSKFSGEELRTLGAKKVLQIPYYLWRREMQEIRHKSVSKKPLILVVGRVELHKRIRESVKVFSCLKKSFPEARLQIIGNSRCNPEYTAQVISDIQTLGLNSSVRLTGKISDSALANAYRRADCLLVLSAHEGFCVPIVEAMFAGLPVVAAAAGAVPETLGSVGAIVPMNFSVEEAAEAIKRLFVEKTVRSSLFEAIAEERKRYDPKMVAQAYVRLINEAV